MDQTFVMEMGRNALASKNKLDKLSLLIEASKIVNSALNIDTLLGLIMDVATRSISADRGTLYLIDTATDELWSKIAQGVDMVEIRLPVGKGLAGYVARTGEIVNITNAYQDPRFNPEIDKKSGYSTQTVLCMPMRNREGVIVGVFQLLNKRTGHFGSGGRGIHRCALGARCHRDSRTPASPNEMVESERLSAVGRMASTILHDIKNPLAIMRLYADIIRRGSQRSQDPATMADQMIRQIDRFNSMAEEILDFAHGVSEISIESVELGTVTRPPCSASSSPTSHPATSRWSATSGTQVRACSTWISLPAQCTISPAMRRMRCPTAGR